MGQKTDPTLLRLNKTNQHWRGCWYSDGEYATQFLEDCTINAYIKNCSQQLKKILPVSFIKRQRGDLQIALFSTKSAQLTSVGFAARRTFAGYKKRFYKNVLASTFLPPHPLLLLRTLGTSKGGCGEGVPRRTGDQLGVSNQVEGVAPPVTGRANLGFFKAFLFAGGLIGCNHKNLSLAPGRQFSNEGGSTCFVQGKGGAPYRKELRENAALKNQIGFNVRRGVGYKSKIHLIKCPSAHQNALFLASAIVDLLENRYQFRRLKNRIVESIQRDGNIKGIRITCSGRVAARSKKAQKARTDSIQWGSTGTNIFSEYLDFASCPALTTFGKVGVKVWICYERKRILSVLK